MSRAHARNGVFRLALLAGVMLLSASAFATIHDIDIVNFAFQPPKTMVSFGDTVRWTLQSGVHTTTSDVTSPKTWDSGTMSSVGQQFQIVFTEADGFGPFPYHCTIHSTTMKDTIFFQPPSVPSLTATPIIGGFDRPVWATSPPDDYQRLFVLEQHTGLVKIYDIDGDSVFSQPFLDVSGHISGGNEQGLLGLAFHPDYGSNGFFYVDLTNAAGDTRVVRYSVSANPDSADENSADTILSVDQPFANHNAGWIGFGPLDGYLYVTLGDGGSAGDPNGNGQNTNTLLASILRLDVDGGTPYAIPSDNPFAIAGGQPEIWDYGVRNPWRPSFDLGTGDLYIADVGQGEWEEIDFHEAGASGGINFGWNLKEGTHCYNPPTNCDPLGLTTEPFYEYPHGAECSITGGFVYRGCAIPGLDGTYFFADYCSGKVWSLRYDGSTMIDFQDRTTELGLTSGALTSFATDNYGEIYIIYQDGSIYKIEVAAGYPDCNMNNVNDSCEIAVGHAADDNSNGIPDQCEPSFICGDANHDGVANITDAVHIIQWIFAGGPAPDPIEAGDCNCDDVPNITDAVYLIQWIFAGGPAPCEACP